MFRTSYLLVLTFSGKVPAKVCPRYFPTRKAMAAATVLTEKKTTKMSLMETVVRQVHGIDLVFCLTWPGLIHLLPSDEHDDDEEDEISFAPDDQLERRVASGGGGNSAGSGAVNAAATGKFRRCCIWLCRTQE